MFDWLSKHKFQAHLTAFLLMIFSSIGVVFSVRGNSVGFIWIMVAIFASANVLAVFVK